MSKNEIRLNFNVKKPILACGADIKGAFAVAIGRKVYLFGGFGDLGDADNLSKYRSSIEREWRKLKPALIVCDMHPGYFSTRCAEFLFDRAKGIGRLYRVQHHEAHSKFHSRSRDCGDATVRL